VAEGLFLAEHCMLEAEVEIQIHYYGHDLSLYMPSKKIEKLPSQIEQIGIWQ
jgi:hypothetical protein